MLNKEERNSIEGEILLKSKKAMKHILEIAGSSMDKERFQHFRTLVFNTFGVSGLQSEVKSILDKYESKE
jgi:hypothetical protein